MKIIDFQKFLRRKLDNDNLRLQKGAGYRTVERSISDIKDTNF